MGYISGYKDGARRETLTVLLLHLAAGKSQFKLLIKYEDRQTAQMDIMTVLIEFPPG